MQVKAQGLINAARWLESQYGSDAVASVLERCSPAVRARYSSAIAIEWHPVAEFIEFLRAAEAAVGNGDGSIAREMGANGARLNTRGIVKRSLFYLASPDYLLRRIAALWVQFNDQGAMHLRHLDDKYGLIEVVGVPKPDVLFCATLTGWTAVIAEAVGLLRPTVSHSKCRARGDAQCLWHVTWGGRASGNSGYPAPSRD